MLRDSNWYDLWVQSERDLELHEAMLEQGFVDPHELKELQRDDRRLARVFNMERFGR